MESSWAISFKKDLANETIDQKTSKNILTKTNALLKLMSNTLKDT